MAATLTLKDSLGGSVAAFENGSVPVAMEVQGTVVTALVSPYNTLNFSVVSGTTISADINLANPNTWTAQQTFAAGIAGEVQWVVLKGKPNITLSPVGTATAGVTLLNNGADYGPDTPSTATNGWNEAITAAMLSNTPNVISVLSGTHSVDWTQLGTLVSNVMFVGEGYVASGTLTGTVVKVTKTPTGATQDQVDFVNCLWSGITFTCPSPTGFNTVTPGGLLYGYGNVNNAFEDCTFIDFQPPIVNHHGDRLRVERCRMIQSGSPPSPLFSNFYQMTTNFKFCDSEMNFAPTAVTASGTSGILIGASGPGIGGGTYENWWISGNRFLDANKSGYAIDTICDLEVSYQTGSPNVMKNVWFTRNVCYNGKIDLNSGDNIWIQDNEWHFTEYAGTGTTGTTEASMVYIINTGAGNLGDVHIRDNTYIQDTNVPAGVYMKALHISPQNTMRSLDITGNRFYISSTNTTSPAGIIVMTTPTGNAPGTYVDLVDITDNEFGFCVQPTTPVPVISVDTNSSGTVGIVFNQVRIRGNRLLGATGASSMYPPTIGGTLASQFVRVSFGGHAITVNALDIEGNYVDSGGTLTSSFVSLAGYVTLGDVVVSRNVATEFTGTATGWFYVGGTVTAVNTAITNNVGNTGGPTFFNVTGSFVSTQLVRIGNISDTGDTIVDSLNGATGALTLAGGIGATVTATGSTISVLTSNVPWYEIIGNAQVTVSPVGTATAGITLPNNGADFGPDTTNTHTCGLQEAENTGLSYAILGGTFQITQSLFISTSNKTVVADAGAVINVAPGVTFPSCDGAAGSTIWTQMVIFGNVSNVDWYGGVLQNQNTANSSISGFVFAGNVSGINLYSPNVIGTTRWAFWTTGYSKGIGTIIADGPVSQVSIISPTVTGAGNTIVPDGGLLKLDLNATAANVSNISLINPQATGLNCMGVDIQNDEQSHGIFSNIQVLGGNIVASSTVSAGGFGLYVEASHNLPLYAAQDVVFRDVMVTGFPVGARMYNVNQRVTFDNVTVNNAGGLYGFDVIPENASTVSVQNHFRFRNCKALGYVTGYRLDTVPGNSGVAINDVSFESCVADDNGAGTMTSGLMFVNSATKTLNTIHVIDSNFSQVAAGGTICNLTGYTASGATDVVFIGCTGIPDTIVDSLVAGTGIGVSGATGTVTISASSVPVNVVVGRASLTITPNGPTDGGDFGPNTTLGGGPGQTGGTLSVTSGISEALAYVSANSGTVPGIVKLVGGKSHFYYVATTVALMSYANIEGDGCIVMATVGAAFSPIFGNPSNQALVGLHFTGFGINGNGASTGYTLKSATVTASPYTYVPVAGQSQQVVVSGGTVTSVVLNGLTSPNNTGVFYITPTDTLVITYTSLPTVQYQLMTDGIWVHDALMCKWDLYNLFSGNNASIAAQMGAGILMNLDAGTITNSAKNEIHLQAGISAGWWCALRFNGSSSLPTPNHDVWMSMQGNKARGVDVAQWADTITLYKPIITTTGITAEGATGVWIGSAGVGTTLASVARFTCFDLEESATSGTNQHGVRIGNYQHGVTAVPGIMFYHAGFLGTQGNYASHFIDLRSPVVYDYEFTDSYAATYYGPKQSFMVNGQSNQLGVMPSIAAICSPNPAGITSTGAFVMLGLGQLATVAVPEFIPRLTGKVKVIVTGKAGNNTASDGYSLKGAFGTVAGSPSGLTPPANGDSVVGVVCTNPQGYTTGNATPPFSVCGMATLTVGATYWFDLQVESTTGGTVTVSNVGVIIEELAA